jgi:hypothetical protein
MSDGWHIAIRVTRVVVGVVVMVVVAAVVGNASQFTLQAAKMCSSTSVV